MLSGHFEARSRDARDERGSAVPFLVACLAVLLLLGAALGVVAALVSAHRSAQSAADLTALAVAAAVLEGGSAGDPCAVGAVIAAANGARLSSCVVVDGDASVRVVVDGPHWLGQSADLEAEARAGRA